MCCLQQESAVQLRLAYFKLAAFLYTLKRQRAACHCLKVNDMLWSRCILKMCLKCAFNDSRRICRGHDLWTLRKAR